MNRLNFLKRLGLLAGAVVVAPKLLAEQGPETVDIVISNNNPQTLPVTLFGGNPDEGITIHSLDRPGAKPTQVWLFNNDLFVPLMTNNGSGYQSIAYKGLADAKTENVHYFDGYTIDSGSQSHQSVTIHCTDANGNTTQRFTNAFLRPEQYDTVRKCWSKFTIDRYTQIYFTIRPGETIHFVPIAAQKVVYRPTAMGSIEEQLYNFDK